MTAEERAALQSELAGLKSESAAKVASLEDTIANLAHEIAILRRRLYGNRTERGNTGELQLALGGLLAAEAQLQRDLAAAAATRTPLQSRRTIRSRRAVHRSRAVVAICLRATCRGSRSRSDAELEEQGCRRIGFEDSAQLTFRRGGFIVFVKRVAKYE